MQHQGKIALVTGAQQGIGAAMALAFAAAGADVAVNWLDDEAAAERVAEGVRGHGSRALLVRADIGNLAACGRWRPKRRADSGRSTCLSTTPASSRACHSWN